MELKLCVKFQGFKIFSAFNRTSMELKLSQIHNDHDQFPAFNRTSMELKLFPALSQSAMIRTLLIEPVWN